MAFAYCLDRTDFEWASLPIAMLFASWLCNSPANWKWWQEDKPCKSLPKSSTQQKWEQPPNQCLSQVLFAKHNPLQWSWDCAPGWQSWHGRHCDLRGCPGSGRKQHEHWFDVTYPTTISGSWSASLTLYLQCTAELFPLSQQTKQRTPLVLMYRFWCPEALGVLSLPQSWSVQFWWWDSKLYNIQTCFKQHLRCTFTINK